jgi:DNA helicase-2/ATP-dependent DNA helicase PcrA
VDPSILADLNPRQREAVEAAPGPVLVVAGAGSGKTRVLTRRIAYLIAAGAPPESILAITFTNKAAKEMRARVESLVGPTLASRLWVLTIHSACARILRVHPELGGLSPGFTIYDTEDARRLIERTIRGLDLDTKRFPPRPILARISAAKADLVGPIEFELAAEGLYDRKVAAIWSAYEEALLAANAVDFDNLVNLVVLGLREHEALREYYQRRFQEVLVDEFQDTNRAQNELVLTLAAPTNHLFVVGDSDQSIYGFRGANLGNILEFADRLPGARVIPLEQNYRSTTAILELANALISRNRHRQAKHLWSDLGEGERPRYHATASDREEAELVVSEVHRALRDGFSLREMAVIYRTNAQSRVLEEELAKAGIPYRVVGGVRFYERREIKDVLCYLRLLANPADDVSLLRVINSPHRGIGAGTQEQLVAAARRRQLPILVALREHGPAALGIASRAARAVAEFLALIDDLGKLAAEVPVPPLLDEVLERTGYLEALTQEDPVTAEGRMENLVELRRMAAESPSLVEFLEASSLFSAMDEELAEGGLALMTVHMAKGLEFDVVCVVGLEEGVFPHLKSLTDPAAIEEERRLLYVAITRARSRLVLSSARRRSFQGDALYNPESRFVNELASVLEMAAPPTERLPERERVCSTRSPLPYQVGDRVFHARYGEGEVRAIRPMAFDLEVEVDFDSVGIRTFFGSMAKLKLV